MEERQDEDQTSDVETAESVAGSPGLVGKEHKQQLASTQKGLGVSVSKLNGYYGWPSELVLYLEGYRCLGINLCPKTTYGTDDPWPPGKRHQQTGKAK